MKSTESINTEEGQKVTKRILFHNIIEGMKIYKPGTNLCDTCEAFEHRLNSNYNEYILKKKKRRSPEWQRKLLKKYKFCLRGWLPDYI